MAVPFEREGYGIKLGHRRKSWKRRFFSLKDGMLSYRVAPGKPPKGTINLVMAHVVYHPNVHADYGQEHVVVIQAATAVDKDLVVRGDTPEEAEAWFHAFKSASRYGVHIRGPVRVPAKLKKAWPNVFLALFGRKLVLYSEAGGKVLKVVDVLGGTVVDNPPKFKGKTMVVAVTPRGAKSHALAFEAPSTVDFTAWHTSIVTAAKTPVLLADDAPAVGSGSAAPPPVSAPPSVRTGDAQPDAPLPASPRSPRAPPPRAPPHVAAMPRKSCLVADPGTRRTTASTVMFVDTPPSSKASSVTVDATPARTRRPTGFAMAPLAPVVDEDAASEASGGEQALDGRRGGAEEDTAEDAPPAVVTIPPDDLQGSVSSSDDGGGFTAASDVVATAERSARYGAQPHPLGDDMDLPHLPALRPNEFHAVLVLTPRPEMPRRLLPALNKWQHRQCASCGTTQSTGRFGVHAHWCAYTELLFCTSCFGKESRPVPWRVIHNLDITPRPVCATAAAFLDATAQLPVVVPAESGSAALAKSTLRRLAKARARAMGLLSAREADPRATAAAEAALGATRVYLAAHTTALAIPDVLPAVRGELLEPVNALIARLQAL